MSAGHDLFLDNQLLILQCANALFQCEHALASADKSGLRESAAEAIMS